MRIIRFKTLYPIILAIIVTALGFALVIVTERLTREAILSHLDQQTLNTLREIFPDVGYYTLSNNVYTVYSSGGGKVGYAFYGEGYGYGGDMLLLIGLKDKDTIEGIVVISNRETITYWSRLSSSNFFDQFKGLKIEDCELSRYGGQGGKVDGVSGSTVSSRAVTDAVRTASMEMVTYIIN